MTTASIEMRARHAAHRLAPLLVRRGGGPLCEGSASHVETIDGQSWLTLAPVAARALCPEASSEPLYVHSTDPGIGHWTLVARHARAIDPRTLAVALEGARMEDQLDRRRIAAEGLVLVASRGVGDLRALPIRDVSNDMCSFHSSRGFPPGTSLGTVIVVGDRGVLRRAPAAVVGSHPFVRSDGGSSFLVRARFDVAPLPEPIDYDVVDDPDQVRRLLELAGLLAVPLDDSGHRIERVSRDRLQFSGEVPADPWRFRFRLFGMAYEAMVRRVSVDRTSFPLVLRRCQRRTDERTEIPMGEPMQIAFTNPITGTRVQERVLDVSVGGLRFSAGERNILWHELKLADADLLTAHSTIPLGTLEVRGLEPTSTRIECHAQFLLPADQRSRDLYDLVARLRRPELTPHDGAAFEPQMTLYRRMGLLMPYMEDQLRSGDAEANWRRAHAPDSGICRTLHRVENDEVVASVTALRAWNDTWLGEHLAAIPGRGGCTPGTLLLAFLEDVLPRPTCRHMVFFTKSGNAKMAGLHQRFQELTGTAEAMACAELRVWMVRRLRQVEPTTSLPLPMREARAADISLIARAASRDLGHLAARGLAMTAQGLLATDIEGAFAEHGLVRQRTMLVEDRPRPRVALLTERCSPGLCLPGLLNATWVLPLHYENAEPFGATIQQALMQLPLESHEPNRLVLAPACVAPSSLQQAGLEHVVDATAYVLSRAGLWRYSSFLTEAYGAPREVSKVSA